MTGSGSTAHFAQYGPVLVVEQWDKKRTKDRMPLCHGSIFVPYVSAPVGGTLLRKQTTGTDKRVNYQY